MIQLLFIRHGATAGNLEKRYIGRTDEPLCEVGIVQATALKQQDFRADRLFASPLLRARQTAELAFPQMPCTVVEAFAETNFGSFEGKTARELSGDPAYQSWVDSMCLAPIPCGESVSDFKVRCRRAFVQVMETIPDGSTAAFVVHGGVIMAILEGFAQPPADFYRYHIGNGAYLHGVYENGHIRVIEPCSQPPASR